MTQRMKRFLVGAVELLVTIALVCLFWFVVAASSPPASYQVSSW